MRRPVMVIASVVALVAALSLGGYLYWHSKYVVSAGPGEAAVVGVDSDGSPFATKSEPVTAAERRQLPTMACAAGSDNCVVATGRVIYVEKVDPDGDGDAHFVTLSDEDVTGAGLTVFDVRPDLRPDPLPEEGDVVGGLGPVYAGSYGQRQIEVTEFHVAR